MGFRPWTEVSPTRRKTRPLRVRFTTRSSGPFQPIQSFQSDSSYRRHWHQNCRNRFRKVLTMQLIYLLSALIVVGIVAWLINAYIPIPRNIKTILNAVLALIVVGLPLCLINTYIPMAGSINAILNIDGVVETSGSVPE